jgi:hypothetical protein
MPINPAEIPQYPQTLTIVPLEAEGNPNVFAFMCVFPTGVRFNVSATFPPHGLVDVAMAKDFAVRVVHQLIEKRDDASVRNTNWSSATAAIQRLLVDFNNKRNYEAPSMLLGPDGRPLQ